MAEGSITKLLRDRGFRNVRSFKEIQRLFIEISRSIIGSHRLVYGDEERSWRITSLELYLDTDVCSDVWRDPYTHGSPAQAVSGTWYVHDDGNRAPFYSGIDIACGSEGMFGGLLIRELCEEHRWVFQKIIRGEKVNKERRGNIWTKDEIETIKNDIHQQPIDIGKLKLVRVPEAIEPIFIGPRIGLNKKDGVESQNPEGVSFRTADLRTATTPTSVLKAAMKPVPID